MVSFTTIRLFLLSCLMLLVGLSLSVAPALADGNVLRGFDAPKVFPLAAATYYPIGVTSDGTNLYYSQPANSPGAIFYITPTGTLLKTLVSVPNAGALAWDGSDLWVGLFARREGATCSPGVSGCALLYKVDPSTGNVIKTVDISQIFAADQECNVIDGLSFDPSSGTLWVSPDVGCAFAFTNNVCSIGFAYNIDTSGNLASAPQTVTVNDNQNPVVHCPTDITVYTTNAAGIAVTFSPTADDNCGVQSLVANPASGSNFPIGDTAVTVTATDIHGNTNQCSFTVTVILDHAPVAGSINLGAVANHPRTLLIDKVLGEATDLDANTLTLTAVSANSTNGGTVTLTETNIIYTPVSNFAGADLFTYTISDGHSGTASGSVLILVLSESEASLNQVGQPIATTNGTVVVRFAGIPGLTYSVQRSSDQVNWNSAGSYVVPDTGIAEYTDSTPAPQPPYYYRTVIQ